VVLLSTTHIFSVSILSYTHTHNIYIYHNHIKGKPSFDSIAHHHYHVNRVLRLLVSTSRCLVAAPTGHNR